jgi:dihydrofolate reductase
MYETMAYWETVSDGPEQPAAVREWKRIWMSAEKIVYSRTLQEVSSARTRIEREFEPEGVRRLKAESPADLTVGGAELAGRALALGLVDEVQLFLNPVIVGGGKAALPDGVRTGLELLEEHRFGGGVVYLRYAVGT